MTNSKKKKKPINSISLSEPDKVSRQAAVTGHPSMFNRESLCKPVTHLDTISGFTSKSNKITKSQPKGPSGL